MPRTLELTHVPNAEQRASLRLGPLLMEPWATRSIKAMSDGTGALEIGCFSTMPYQLQHSAIRSMTCNKQNVS